MHRLRIAIFAILLCGFASLPSAVSQDKKEVPKEVKKEEPPVPKAEVVESYDPTKSDLEMLKAADIPDEGEPLLKFFQQRTLSEGDRVKILALIRQLGDDSFDVREEASEKVEQFGLAAIGLLRQSERDADAEIARRCEVSLRRIEKVPSQSLSSTIARRLAVHKPDGTAETLLAYLPMADDEAVTEEVRTTLAAVAMKNGQPNKALVQALSDPLAVRRGCAAEALVRGKAEGLYPQLKEMLRKEPDIGNRVRMNVAFVVAAKQKDMVEPLIALLADVPQELGWQAEDVLCRLAGEEGGPKVALGSDAESRGKCRDAWKEWWTKNEKTIDLAKLEDRPRLLGFTLVLQMDVRGVNGKVEELGIDGKPRWKVEGLQFPIDAQILPGNRLLVAEHNKHTISEREITTGKIIWQQQVLMPVSLQKLPDGNMFVAARNQLYEFDRERKQIFTYARPQHDIVAAQKMRGGDMLFVTNNGQLVRINKKGEQIKTFSVGRVNYCSGLEALPNNRVLVTQWNGVAEYDLETGQSKWSAQVNTPTSVQRLPNGNTLVASMNTMKVVELDSNGKQVWEYQPPGARPWRAKRR